MYGLERGLEDGEEEMDFIRFRLNSYRASLEVATFEFASSRGATAFVDTLGGLYRAGAAEPR